MKLKKLLLALFLLPCLVSAQETKVKRLEFTVEPGFMFGVQEGSATSLTLTGGIGSWLDKNIYLGLHSGAFIPLVDGAKASIPLFARVEYKFNENKTSGISLPFDAGFLINSDAAMIGVVPSYTLELNKWSNIKFGLGYMIGISTKGYGASHNLITRVSINMHKNTSNPRIKRQIKPSRYSGLQYSIEGGITNFNREDESLWGMIGIALTYKWNPHISFGVAVKREDIMNSYALRGQYRLNDKRCSPIGALDIGLTSLNEDGKKDNSIYASPSLGLSIRAGESYFDIKAGYNIGSKLQGVDIYNINGLFIGLSWTHTTKLLQRKSHN